jgi:hypothetical protein
LGGQISKIGTVLKIVHIVRRLGSGVTGGRVRVSFVSRRSGGRRLRRPRAGHTCRSAGSGSHSGLRRGLLTRL